MPSITQEGFPENLRKCDFCEKWSARESSTRVSRTTSASNRQIPRAKSQDKKWKCEDHFKKN